MDLSCRGFLSHGPSPPWPRLTWALSAVALSAVASPVPRPPWASSAMPWPRPPWTSLPHTPRTTSAVRLVCCGPRPSQLCRRDLVHCGRLLPWPPLPWASRTISEQASSATGQLGSEARLLPRPPRTSSAVDCVHRGLCLPCHRPSLARPPWASSAAGLVRRESRPPWTPTLSTARTRLRSTCPHLRPSDLLEWSHGTRSLGCTASASARRSRRSEMRRPGRISQVVRTVRCAMVRPV